MIEPQIAQELSTPESILWAAVLRTYFDDADLISKQLSRKELNARIAKFIDKGSVEK